MKKRKCHLEVFLCFLLLLLERGQLLSQLLLFDLETAEFSLQFGDAALVFSLVFKLLEVGLILLGLFFR